MNVRFIINPASGRRRDLDRLGEAIARRCGRAGLAASVRRCDRKEDLDALVADAKRERVEALIAVGGDGTVHEIGTRLIDSPIALGILPAGSGNGLARHLGIPMDMVSALDAIASSRVEPVDTGLADGRPFLGVAGVGFDAEVAHRFGLRGKRGLETYVREAILLLRGYRPADYVVTVDGETIRSRALLVTVANSSQYGNEARIAPAASLRDGLLDVCILADPPLLAVPLLLRRLFTGQLRDGSGVTIRRGRTIEIAREAAGKAHVDGEPIELPARIRFTVHPGSLRILRPAGTRAI
ncbi:MAG: diacylglycerol/lipid kinase family protein [Thermoanaerobaculia bacterium]